MKINDFSCFLMIFRQEHARFSTEKCPKKKRRLWKSQVHELRPALRLGREASLEARRAPLDGSAEPRLPLRPGRARACILFARYCRVYSY